MVSFSNLSACFAYCLRSGPRVKVKVVAGGFLSPRSHRGGESGLGIGHDRVVVCGFSGVMISI